MKKNISSKYLPYFANKTREGSRSAFPHKGGLVFQFGLSKREYIAALCMARYSDGSVENRAQLAVKEADALIKELNK